jgi:hypothetical protein
MDFIFKFPLIPISESGSRDSKRRQILKFL